MNWTCPNCREVHEEQFDSCWNCGSKEDGSIAIPPPLPIQPLPPQPPKIELPCSTTPYLPGRVIDSVVGVVFGEAIMGANILRDFAASFTDIVGGRSGAYENNLRNARSIAMQEMIIEARKLGADAVVGADIDYETIGESMLMVAASGTAVKLVPELSNEVSEPPVVS